MISALGSDFITKQLNAGVYVDSIMDTMQFTS